MRKKRGRRLPEIALKTTESVCWCGEWRCCGESQSVLVIDGYNEPGLRGEIEPVEVVRLRFEDHGSRSHAALKANIAATRLAA